MRTFDAVLGRIEQLVHNNEERVELTNEFARILLHGVKTNHQLQSELSAALAKIEELEQRIAEFTRRCEAGYNKLDWLDANERVIELEQRIKESQK